MEQFERTINLIGQENFDKIYNTKIIIFGVGGVGGYALEMLTRCGVNNITIVDFDTINITNLNRQIISLHSNLGEYKVDAFSKRIKDINPNINLSIIKERLTSENINSFNLSDFDYVVDCIDSYKDKLGLIEYCYKHNIKIISSMSAGNRYKLSNYVVTDIFKTKNDAMARKLRLDLKKLGIKKLKVCYTDSLSDNINLKTRVLSISYNVALCGATISQYLINEIIKN